MTIFEATDIQKLTGKGIERLVDWAGNIRAEFIDGKIVRTTSRGNTLDTIV